MKLKFLKAAFTGLMLCGASLAANASVITIGSLTLENEGDTYVTDSLNGLDWLRWDQVNTLTFAELTDATNGGAYGGWSIAHNNEALLFHEALFGAVKPCNTNLVNPGCDLIFNDFISLMGYTTPSEFRSRGLFVNDNYDVNIDIADDNWAGYIRAQNTERYPNRYMMKQSISTSPVLRDQAYWEDLADDGEYGFILYRESAAVPEPSTLAIFALGMMGLAARRFKKQA